MTIHRQRRIGGGYGGYYVGFVLALLGLAAVAYVLLTGDGQLEVRPWRPIAYLTAIAIAALVVKRRAARRR
ncbi:hypothetical protein [Patulibacter defluvii]|uniref:hypothetical protein n=1 Tax=Patulibacter defluvii TaxID=3095358 RepID=UPI002A747821|nr:hypothetical protein [Patulibacter sp. DM4]